jgi:hypothetical protein
MSHHIHLFMTMHGACYNSVACIKIELLSEHILIEQAKDLTKLNFFLNTYLNLFLSFEAKYVQLDASCFSQWRTGMYKIPFHT